LTFLPPSISCEQGEKMSYYTFAENIRRGNPDPEFAKMQRSYDPKRVEKLLAGTRLRRVVKEDDPGTYTCWQGIQNAKDTLWNLDTGEDGAASSRKPVLRRLLDNQMVLINRNP